MAIYAKTARQQLVELINEGNPDLPFPINEADYDFTTPTSIAPTPEGHNTEIRLIAKLSSPYTGNVTLTYRRLNLAYLFRGIVPTVKKWVANSGSTTAGNAVYNLHALLPIYTKKYGINLETSQINNITLYEYNGNDPARLFNISARGDSLIFVGSTQARWVIGKRTLEDLIQIDEAEGRLYPDGNDFSDTNVRKSYITPLTYHFDFTMYYQENTYYWTYNNTYHFYGTTYFRNLNQENLYLDILKPLFLEQFGYTIVHSSYYTSRTTVNVGTAEEPVYEDRVGFRGIYYRHINLPNANYPEANSEFYNSAIVIELPDDCTWGTGLIFLHFNK